jgi:AraC-like DNA-binding protein
MNTFAYIIYNTERIMAKYQQIKPADVYVTNEQRRIVDEDRRNGIAHPEITDIRLTGNSFLDLFASLIEAGGGIQTKDLAARMGVKPALLGAAIEAMTGLPAHEWAKEYVDHAASDSLRSSGSNLSSLASSLGFRSVSAFSHFFYRRFGQYPKQWAEENHRHVQLKVES